MSTRSPYALACLLLTGCAALADAPDADGPLANETARSCVREEPARRAEVDQLAANTSVVIDCMSDDGACQAATECVRDADARECDTSRLIGPAAAGCIAGKSGLAIGLSGFEVNLGYDLAERRILWHVMNTLDQSGTGASNGQSWSIDAVTGEVLSKFDWSATP
jgi:hypothetical protein